MRGTQRSFVKGRFARVDKSEEGSHRIGKNDQFTDVLDDFLVELAGHKSLTLDTDLDIYFCDPHSP